MNRRIKDSHKRNLRFFSIILFTLMITVNLTIFLVSENFKENKLNEENEEFLLLTTFLIEDNDVEVAIEYIDHYSESHNVEVEIFNGETKIYTSVEGAFTYTSHQISTSKGEFSINIDNTHNITVDLLNQKYIFANIISIMLFFIAITTLYVWNKRTNLKIEKDVLFLLQLIQDEVSVKEQFSFSEFEVLQQNISSYIAELDMLRSRRQLNIKGLAHDIKTPLTIINDYVQNNDYTVQQRNTVIKSIQKISRLVDNIINDDYKSSFVDISINEIVKETVSEYEAIFKSKQITIELNSSCNINQNWNKKDFKVVLENLFSNAYYYSIENSVYQINIIEESNIPKIEFISIGNSIPKDQLQRIFEKGFRNSELKHKNVSGKGLGLYLTKLLLQPIDAEITASTNKQKNIFTITFKKS